MHCLRLRSATLLVLAAWLALSCRPSVQPSSPTPAPAATASSSCEYGWWWLSAHFQPSQASIEGLPLRRIDSTWTAALPLSRSVLPPTATCDSTQSTKDDSSLVFAIDGDFNHDGIPDQALAGVYRNGKGAEGRFLLFLTRRGDGWQVADLLSMEGEAGFSVLTQHADTIGWWFCLECDDGFTVAWDGRSYRPLPQDSR